MTKDVKFVKLSRDDEDKTKIMAGHVAFSVRQLENEIDAKSEIGKKLKEIEDQLEKY